MKESKREITDLQEIFGILEHCTSISLGMNTEDFPYIIPMTFGCRLEEDKIVVYFHCAGHGRKWELLHRDARVCVEGHVYERVVMTGTNSITADYESVIGFGTAELILEKAAKIDAIKVMLAHYNSSGFPATSCEGLQRVEVYRVVLDRVTGKRSK